MKVTLQLRDGRVMTFSKEKLTDILEKHFSDEVTSQVKNLEVAARPTEGKWFEVNPLAINQHLFEKKRADSQQEATRKLILEAFEEMKKNPKYARPFKTMMTEKTWEMKTVGELKKMASKLGDHNADWVEQVFEWAQRIANGETWEAVCNEVDTANWYRLVVWKNGYARLVGGSCLCDSSYPVSSVRFSDYYDFNLISRTVPLVVLY